MKRSLFIPSTALRACFLLSSFIFSCTPASGQSTPQLVTVYATDAAQPWLTELYACAADSGAVLTLSADSPDIFLRLGQPADLTTPAFQIDVDDILIVVNKQSPLGNLTLEQARIFFTGRGDPTAQVWVYASAEEPQMIFEQAVMDGRGVTSFARLAVSPAHMVEALSADPNAVGILPRHWMTAGLRELFLAASVPVLALTPSEPTGIVRDLVACLQKKGD